MAIPQTNPEVSTYVQWVYLPTRQEAFDSAALSTLSEKLAVPEQDIDPDILAEYKDSVLSTYKVAEMVKINPSHRLWPKVLEDSQAVSEFSIEFRTSSYPRVRDIKTVDFYNKADVGKFLISAAQFDRPEGAKTIRELAAKLRTTPYIIDKVLLDNDIATESFRHPAVEEFDEFITAEGIGAVIRAIHRGRIR